MPFGASALTHTVIRLMAVLALVIYAAVRFQVVREILIGFSVLSVTLGVISLGIGWLITRISKNRGIGLIQAAGYTFLILWVFWGATNLSKLPEYRAGKVYWNNMCLCFEETEQARLERQREEERKKQEEERKRQFGCPDVMQSPWDGSVLQVKEWFDKHLFDPKSLDVIRWGELVEVYGGCTIWVRYRAKNAFGGYIIKESTFFISRDGEVVLLLTDK